MDLKTYRTAIALPESALNCKMIYNASSELNGKIAVGFNEISNAVVTIYKWPNYLKSWKTHGIIENDDVSPAEYGKVYEAPTDWTIVVSHYFGPDKAAIRTTSWVSWYTE
jgi:hypothetical protein